MNRSEIAQQLRDIADTIDPPEPGMRPRVSLQVAVMVDGQTVNAQQMQLHPGQKWQFATGIRPEGWPGNRGVDILVTRWEDQ